MIYFVCPHNIQNISETYLRNIYIFLLHEDQNWYEKVLSKEFRKKCDMYMIIIKIDCCGHPQTSSDAMQFEHLDVLRCYVGKRVKWLLSPSPGKKLLSDHSSNLPNCTDRNLEGCFISNLFMEDMFWNSFVPEEFSTKANQDEIKG